MAIVGEPRNVNTHANNPESIHDYVVPTAVCTHVLYKLIVTVQLSFPSDQSEHRIHPGDTTHTPHTHRVKCRARVPRLKIILTHFFSPPIFFPHQIHSIIGCNLT